jgi:uncharacterized membrane protein
MADQMASEIIVLRFVHVVGGIFWVGAMLFANLFLFPALAGAGPGAGAVMAGLQRRKMMQVLPAVAVLTILAGARLMWINGSSTGGVYFHTTTGRVIALGAAAGILSFFVGILIGRPAGMRGGQLNAAIARASESERAALAAELAVVNRRLQLSGTSTVVLLIIAAGAMAVARYLG